MGSEIWDKSSIAMSNGDFIWLQTQSGYRSALIDEDVEDIILPSDVSDEDLGEMILRSLLRSRFLCLHDALVRRDRAPQIYEARVQTVLKLRNYKSRRALFKYMKSCPIEIRDSKIKIMPTRHDKLEGWGRAKSDGIEDVYVHEDASRAEIGAALRLAFSRCI